MYLGHWLISRFAKRWKFIKIHEEVIKEKSVQYAINQQLAYWHCPQFCIDTVVWREKTLKSNTVEFSDFLCVSRHSIRSLCSDTGKMLRVKTCKNNRVSMN